jgi:hypothetical protein
MVSEETHDRTIADSIRPSAENRYTTVRSGQVVARGVIGPGWVRVVDISDLLNMGDMEAACEYAESRCSRLDPLKETSGGAVPQSVSSQDQTIRTAAIQPFAPSSHPK